MKDYIVLISPIISLGYRSLLRCLVHVLHFKFTLKALDFDFWAVAFNELWWWIFLIVIIFLLFARCHLLCHDHLELGRLLSSLIVSIDDLILLVA
jgi:hypothetical protein